MGFPISHVRYVALSVSDLEQESRFFRENWGLLPTPFQLPEAAFLSAAGSTEPYLLRLAQGEYQGLALLALAAHDRDTVDRLFDRISARGEKIITEPQQLRHPGGGYGFRFFDLDGRALEISSDVEQRVPETSAAGAALPLDISHVVLHTPDPAQAAAYYNEVLGFVASDWLGDRMCFLRTNKKHHSLAMLVGEPGLNHVAFDMGSTNNVMRAVGRLIRGGTSIKWGPGRHTAGDNTFAYFFSPAGFMVEYTAELEEVADDWQPTVYPPTAEVADQWGTGALAGPFQPHRAPRDPGLWSEPRW